MCSACLLSWYWFALTLLSKGTRWPKSCQFSAVRPAPFTCTRPLAENIIKDDSSDHYASSFFFLSHISEDNWTLQKMQASLLLKVYALRPCSCSCPCSALPAFLRICYLTCLLPGEPMTKVVYSPRTFGKATGRLRMIFHTFCTPICSNSRYLAFAHQITPTYPMCKKARVITVLSNPLSFTKLHKTCKWMCFHYIRPLF